MIAALMVYGALVGLCLSGAGWWLERGAALAGRPRRWIWVGVMVALAVLMAVAPRRTLTASGVTIVTTVEGAREAGDPVAGVRPTPLADVGRRVHDGLDDTLAAALPVDSWLSAFWVASSSAVLIVYLSGLAALHRRRREWRNAVIDAERVLVAPDLGPAVVGLLPARIVLPEWALSLDAEARTLVLAHEREHVRAADSWLLHAAAMLVVAMPWNPLAWWVASRLRLAIEIDCDARVIRALDVTAEGTARQRYGDLLLTVAARQSTPSRLFVVPALLESSSTLARRITAMFPRPLRLVGARTVVALGVALLLTGAAVITPSARLLAQAPIIASPSDTLWMAALPVATSPSAILLTSAQAPAGSTSWLSYEDWATLLRTQHDDLKRVAAATGGFCICFSNDFGPELTPLPSLAQVVPPAPSTSPSPAPPLPSQDADAPKPDGFGQGALSASDTVGLVKPVPLTRPTPLYTADAMRMRIMGDIGVEVVVGSDGTVEDARISQSLDKVYGLDDATLAVVRRWTFTPATLDGTAVRVRMFLNFNLQLH